jgi:hypothetical protein
MQVVRQRGKFLGLHVVGSHKCKYSAALNLLSAVFMGFLASQKHNKRFINGCFQAFLPEKAHEYCAI